MAPRYKVTYFDCKGFGELLRYLLSYGGFEFEDVRISDDDWPKHKANTPFGKLPMIEIDGKKYHQGIAHVRYLAKETGIAGKDNEEALLIDMAADTIIDILVEVGQYWWILPDSEKPKIKEEILTQSFPLYFSRLEKQVADNNGFLVNGKLSYADLVLAASLGSISGIMKVDPLDGRKNLRSLVDRVNELPGIKEWLKKRPISEF